MSRPQLTRDPLGSHNVAERDMPRIGLISVVGVLTLVAANARAQVCAGFPSLRTFQIGGFVQAAGAAAVNSDAASYGGSLSAGRRLFGVLRIGSTHVEAFEDGSLDLSVGAGFEIPLTPDHGVAICPGAEFAVGAGPNNINGTPYDLHTEQPVFRPQYRRRCSESAAPSPYSFRLSRCGYGEELDL